MRINFSYIYAGRTFTETLSKEVTEDLYRLHGEGTIDAAIGIIEDQRNVVIDVAQRDAIKKSILEQIEVT